MKIDFNGEQAGSILYFDGTDWIQLSPGNDGYILSINSDVPYWSNVIQNNINCKVFKINL